MLILIENPLTLEYLNREGRWTKNTKEAAIYRTSRMAKESGATAAIGEFRVVGVFKNSAQITNLDEGCGSKKEEGI